MAAGYTEHASTALASMLTEMRRVGAGNDGNVGDASHTYGYHLSANRLRGTGHSGDYSLQGGVNAVADPQAACAQDVIMDFPAARAWVAWMFSEYAAGRLPHVVEIIGSLDGKVASYAAISTGRKRVAYNGTGHIDWAHVAHGRAYANWNGFGKEVLGAWTSTGYKGKTPERHAKMDFVLLDDDVAALVIRGTNGCPYLRLIEADGSARTGWIKLSDQKLGSGVSAVTASGKDLWITALDPSDKSVLLLSVPDAFAPSVVITKSQDLQGVGDGDTPAICRTRNGFVVAVGGTRPVTGEIWLNLWDGTKWRGWWDAAGQAG